LAADEMGIPAIKKAIRKENDKLRTSGRNEIANAVDAVLKLC
tara:strand:- start:87 stop:212 length:126 start_codon:yes stop_codon:yes gene_type:complete